MKNRVRDTRSNEHVSVETALMRGLAPSGGLYVPTEFPSVSIGPETDLVSVAHDVLLPWMGSIQDAAGLFKDALDFPMPLVPLNGPWAGVHVLELFHGPTRSFKDVGARVMGRWLRAALKRRGERRIVLVATSGDTGSAVADGFAGGDEVSVVLLYPKGKVSATQEKQLVAPREGVHPFAVEGTFDDCQRMVKAVLTAPEAPPLSTANSINIGRLLPQQVYYHYAAAKLETPPLFIVPSGNLGNLTAGLLAARAGMPHAGFVAAHNANAFFPHLLASGVEETRATVATLSNAMDVGQPSNFERLTALFELPELKKRVSGVSINDARTRATMRAVWEETGYLADPHTAVGLAAARDRRPTGAPIVVLATAHPAKFPDIVHDAVGTLPQDDVLGELPDRADPVPTLPADAAALLEQLHVIY